MWGGGDCGEKREQGGGKKNPLSVAPLNSPYQITATEDQWKSLVGGGGERKLASRRLRSSVGSDIFLCGRIRPLEAKDGKERKVRDHNSIWSGLLILKIPS